MRALASLYKPKKKKLQLPNVTLCAVDCLNQDLTRYALECCKAQVDFGKILFITDKDYNDYPTEKIERFKNKQDYDYFIMKRLNPYITTDYVLLVQWDGLILDSKYWLEEFLEYDYIGAIWPWHPIGYRVGNSGFCLRSKKLLEILYNDENINESFPEDIKLCTQYRPYLESKGIKWPSEFIADVFSVERSNAINTFGFHGFFQFHKFIDVNYIEEFLDLLPNSTLKGQEMMENIQSFHNKGDIITASKIMRHLVSNCDNHTHKQNFINYIHQFNM
jgi:hypothetical protein